MEQRSKHSQLIGYISAGILLLGAFLPMMSLPIVGSISYFNNGRGDGIFIIILAIISAVLSNRMKFKYLLGTGGISLLMLSYVLYTVHTALSEMKDSMSNELAGNPFAGLAEMAVNSIQLQWGWFVMVIGAVGIVSSAVIALNLDEVIVEKIKNL